MGEKKVLVGTVESIVIIKPNDDNNIYHFEILLLSPEGSFHKIQYNISLIHKDSADTLMEKIKGKLVRITSNSCNDVSSEHNKWNSDGPIEFIDSATN